MSSRSLTGLLGDHEKCAKWVEEYINPAGAYAFNTYDLSPVPNGALEPSDIMMANLLNLNLRAKYVIPVFAEAGPAKELRAALDRAITDLPTDKAFEDFDSAEDFESEAEALGAADRATVGVSNWTPIAVSKVLHRRRPNLVPLIDRQVMRFYGTWRGTRGDQRVEAARATRGALWADIDRNREALSRIALQFQSREKAPPSLIRAADIIIWRSMA